MADETRELVVMLTKGIDHELSTVGFTIANGGITSGLKVCVFLTSTSVDLVRKRGSDLTHLPPFEPLLGLMQDFMRRGGELIVCAPCAKSRGYVKDDLIDGVVISGASIIHEKFKTGAASLSF